jgi:hypothetical protein
MKRLLWLVVLAVMLGVVPLHAQKEREKVYQVVDFVMTAKSYDFFLQHVDVVNGVCINASGIENRITDDALKQRLLFKNSNLTAAIPNIDDAAIVIEKNIAMVNITSNLMNLGAVSETNGIESIGEYENFFLLRKLEGKWKVQRWMQIKIERPQARPPRKEFR